MKGLYDFKNKNWIFCSYLLICHFSCFTIINME